MNIEFKARSDDARKKLLNTTLSVEKKIASIYETAAEELAREAMNANDGSLAERWKTDMAKSLRNRMGQLRGDVTDTILTATTDAAHLPAKATASWLDMVLSRTGQSTKAGSTFQSVLARAPDEALRQVVNGRAYLDGKNLSQRIWSSTGRLQGGIQRVLEQGIAQKRSAREIADDLEIFLNPGAKQPMDWREVYPDIPFKIETDFHAQLLARTSINQAYAIAGREAALLNPFAEAIHWALSPSHYERQVARFGADICDEYAAHNEGLGVGNWPIEKVPLPHPCCLCYQYAVVNKSMDECASELRAWLDGESNPALDASFGKWRGGVTGGVEADLADALDLTSAERRKRQLEQVDSQDWYRSMPLKDRQAVDNRLIDASDEELADWALLGPSPVPKSY